VDAIRGWHAEQQPGALVLLPAEPGPQLPSDAPQLDGRFAADGPASAWLRAALAGSQVLDDAGRVLRRPSGAIFLGGAAAPSGPLRRRAELENLVREAELASIALGSAETELGAALNRLASLEAALTAATTELEKSRETERAALAAQDDAVRFVNNLGRELAAADAELARLIERAGRAEQRLVEVDAALVESDLARARLETELGTTRAELSELETVQEGAREKRAQWQVQEAHVAARLRAATERLERAQSTQSEAEAGVRALTDELAQLDLDCAALAAQQSQWQEARAERQVALLELNAADTDAGAGLEAAERTLESAERDVSVRRTQLEAHTEESHRLQIELTEATGLRRSIVERVETEWRKPIGQLLEEAPPLELDLETLEAEAVRILDALEAIGPVNPLAMEEHADEVKRFEFLSAQRNDLVSARQSLMQAIREIDGTARAMFLETFEAVKVNFHTVFQTLFGGGECDLRLANPEDPLESEIEILAAPRGKRIQHVRLLSMGERTLVATSLLFGLYLTKPSPFCLMDEVDAPLDDANVGRFTRLLDEFKRQTQFIVITHNPRTMHAADAVYGVTMQEPGVSTIVGVRLGEMAVA
jgi:chromosome segregation protein